LVFRAEEPGETALGGFGLADIFVAKYDPDGMLQWARLAGGGSDDRGQGIAVGSENVYVIGRIGQTATFGSGEENQTKLTSAGSSDIFLASYARGTGAPPASSPATLSSALLPNGNPRLTISGSPSTTYTVQRTSTLLNPTWTVAGTLTADDQGQAVFEDVDEDLAFPAFYRVLSN
jgi:hypothetical protein